MMLDKDKLTPEEVEECINLLIKDADDHEKVEALLKLLRAIIDPTGDVERLNIGMTAVEHAYTYSKFFRKAFKDYMSGGITTDIDHKDSIS